MTWIVPDPAAKFGTRTWREHGSYVEGTPVVEVVESDRHECEGCDADGTVYAIAGNREMWTCAPCTESSNWVHTLAFDKSALVAHEVEPADVLPREELIEQPGHKTLNGTNLTDLDAAERALSYLRERYNSGDLERFHDIDGSPTLRVQSRSSGFEHFERFRDTPALKVSEPRAATVETGDGEEEPRLVLNIRERADANRGDSR